ncbi:MULTISPECIES: Asp23/Gls24 family envelope stress response protein [Streptomyces]|uniref:Asp23/Gls24 family envelope stress response protein n=1 Tax=Streptomyces TaxID=1883 RepID=UPI000CD5C4C0|nr:MULTISPECIES: Asp23/Gls24 family envelope stress response protein [Streptomyces]
MTDSADTLAPTVPPAERGATRIAERVVAKLAAQAAREALRSVSASMETPWSPRAAGRGQPEASVSVRRNPGPGGTGGLADVRVAVELGYPSDIGAQCGAVRRQVSRRVLELAGMETTDVAVDIRRLHSEHLSPDGRLR